MENEYYLLLFIKRLKNADYRLAFSYFLDTSFPENMNFSKTLVDGMQAIFSNWILEEAMQNGGWKRQFFAVNGLRERKRLFEFEEFSPKFSCQLLLFLKDLLKIYNSSRRSPFDPPKRDFTSGDRLVIHCFTRELARRDRKALMALFRPALIQIPLNHMLLQEPFLDCEIKPLQLDTDEQLFLDSSMEFFVQEFHNFQATLHCYKQDARLDRIRSLGIRLQSLVSLAHKDFKWCFTMSLLEIFEMILDFDLMNPMRYVDDFENISAIPDHIIQSLILEVSGIFETYYRSLISFSKYLSSFSFVDDEFNEAQLVLEYFTLKFFPRQAEFENKLTEMQAGFQV
tara:strand:+ start:814 stop:1836 length:1023 start_codon:yes stop_codon:yes gene_type:complete